MSVDGWSFRWRVRVQQVHSSVRLQRICPQYVYFDKVRSEQVKLQQVLSQHCSLTTWFTHNISLINRLVNLETCSLTTVSLTTGSLTTYSLAIALIANGSLTSYNRVHSRPFTNNTFPQNMFTYNSFINYSILVNKRSTCNRITHSFANNGLIYNRVHSQQCHSQSDSFATWFTWHEFHSQYIHSHRVTV